jgi:hypothetical protein
MSKLAVKLRHLFEVKTFASQFLSPLDSNTQDSSLYISRCIQLNWGENLPVRTSILDNDHCQVYFVSAKFMLKNNHVGLSL